MSRGYVAHGRYYTRDTFPERLDQLMQEKNENCCDIARVCKVERKTVYYWLNYEIDIKTKHAIAIADHFGVSLDWLLCRKNYGR